MVQFLRKPERSDAATLSAFGRISTSQPGAITTSNLFSPLSIRGETMPNRVFVAPMCQYSSETDGLATSWHMVHLGTRAAGGAGLVVAEATAVRPEGRISPWNQGM